MPRHVAPLIAVVAALGLAGCERTPPTAPAATPAAAPAPIAASTVSVRDARYSIRIAYPELPAGSAPLAAALHAYGDAAKREFMQALEGGAALTQGAGFPWQLTLDFAVAAHTADFVAVRARGGSYTGGAHAAPLVAGFNYDVRRSRVLALGDLFADPAAALRVLADRARGALSQRVLGAEPDDPAAPRPVRSAAQQRALAWIDDGTAPKQANYAAFLVHADAAGRADGLLLMFPPYQVAPYAEGTLEVQVPAAAFAALLRPRYRAAFAAGTAP
ncbi:MAG: DUF3298 domain-containing protein [Mizugakiibacter sp.]|uniref:DUF3298 and DUF4163 domain-containing protein n=1 Tax=Mizugakiibacter sp. TaxID=1972610 RepID=UPI00320D5F6E